MSMTARLTDLTEKHRTLERKIAEEQTRPSADSAKITKWKHEKLRLKEQIVKLEQPTRH